jgi:hypothetical protein
MSVKSEIYHPQSVQNIKSKMSTWQSSWILVFERNLPLVKLNPQKNFKSICQFVLVLQSRIQCPRCPPGGHFGFLKGTGFRKEPSSSASQLTKKISGKSKQAFLSYSTETKVGHTLHMYKYVLYVTYAQVKHYMHRCNTIMPAPKIFVGV